MQNWLHERKGNKKKSMNRPKGKQKVVEVKCRLKMESSQSNFTCS